jgi:spore maturation protein CgeB
MIKRIDLFLPPNVSQYGVLHHFTHKLHEAFLRIGVNARILIAQHDNPKPFLAELFKDVPDCTLSFNGLLPDEEGRFFADLIRIPHFAYVVDSPNGFVSLANSPFTLIGSVDQNACDFFRGVNAKHVFFTPHGVEKNLHPPRDEERPYDVVMLASCIDYEAIRQGWKKKYPAPLATLLEDAAETALRDDKTSYVQAFVAAMDKEMHQGTALDPNKIDFIAILDELEMYIRGKERIELLRSIKDARVDLFGSNAATTTWKKQLAGKTNITFHDPVPYDQALEIMGKAKILLNSCAWIKRGTHERTLAGLAEGALVLTSDNEYMRREKFVDGSNIAFFRYRDLASVNDQIKQYLHDEPLRKKVAHAGREQVMHHHTWDIRAGTLIKELDPILQAMRSAL